MQNIVSIKITQDLYKSFVFSRIHTAGNLDIPKQILVFPPRGSQNAGNRWNLGKLS